MKTCPDVCVVNKIGDLSCAKCGYVFPDSPNDGNYYENQLAGWRTA